jgi:hypothetical protein
MPELSEILKGAVGDVPDFDPAALATRRRRQRRHQATGAASVLIVIATAIVLLLNTGGGGVVVSTRKPAATSTDGGGSTTSSGDTLTTPMSDTIPASTIPPGTIPTTTTIPGARAPQIGDFTGTLTASGSTVRVGEGVDLELRIHNASGDVIDTSRDEYPTTLELYCDVIQNSGPPGKIGVVYYDTAWYLPESTMQPGADGVITGHFVPTTDFLGRASCQAVVLQPPLPRFFPEWDAITAIAPFVITVLPSDGATTTIASTVPTPTS